MSGLHSIVFLFSSRFACSQIKVKFNRLFLYDSAAQVAVPGF